MSNSVKHVNTAEGATPKTALVFMIFLLAGPPLGILLVWGIAAALGLAFRTPDIAAHLRGFGRFVVASYVFGGGQALLVGCVAAVVQAMSPVGLVPIRAVLVACLLAGLVYPAFMIVTGQGLLSWEVLLAWIALHVGSGLLCCLICNAVLGRFRRRSGSQATA